MIWIPSCQLSLTKSAAGICRRPLLPQARVDHLYYVQGRSHLLKSPTPSSPLLATQRHILAVEGAVSVSRAETALVCLLAPHHLGFLAVHLLPGLSREGRWAEHPQVDSLTDALPLWLGNAPSSR